jgi:hypothetical protein
MSKVAKTVPLNQLCGWELTIFTEDVQALKLFLKEKCKKWTFQQESCPTSGRLHFQVKISLNEKLYFNGVKLLFTEFNKPHISPSVVKTFKAFDKDYVTKGYTRVAGPWSYDDPEPKYIPVQYRIDNLRPWQLTIKDSPVHDRAINCIFDEHGNIGKSTLVGVLSCNGLAQSIPFCNDFRDIMRMIMDKPKSSIYLIDLPRAIKKDKLFQMYAGIEIIKGGYCYDDRYSFKEAWFDTPSIWVFTNILPDRKMLSADRWHIWQVSNQHELVRYSPDEERAQQDADFINSVVSKMPYLPTPKANWPEDKTVNLIYDEKGSHGISNYTIPTQKESL